MALVRTFSTITYTFRDNNGKIGRSEITLPPDIAPTALATALESARSVILPLTDAQLLGASLNISYSENEPTTPPATSEVERRLIVSGVVPAQARRIVVTIPSPPFTLESNYTDVVEGSALQPLIGFIAQQWTGYQFRRAYVSHRNRRPKV